MLFHDKPEFELFKKKKNKKLKELGSNFRKNPIQQHSKKGLNACLIRRKIHDEMTWGSSNGDILLFFYLVPAIELS